MKNHNVNVEIKFTPIVIAMLLNMNTLIVTVNLVISRSRYEI